MSAAIVASEELAAAQGPKGVPAWRTALALTLGVATVAATAAAGVAASGSLGVGEQVGLGATAFMGQRRLQPAGFNGTGVASTASAASHGQEEAACLTAAPGEVCHRLVQWVLEDGLLLHPEKYAGLTRSSSFEDVQMALHRTDPDYCPRPCERKQPALSEGGVAERHAAPKEDTSTNSTLWALGGCNYGRRHQKPAHAGCFVSRGGKMLAIRLTYDGNRYDIPGGQTNWKEPARCTAHREALEETGYLVAPRELLAVVRNGFHIYRCHLVKHSPVRGHDHEVSWVGWLSKDQVRSRASQGRFRFPEAHRYAGWLR